MKPILFAGALALAALATADAQPKNPMRPGRYEITMQMEMPGMPMKMPAQKITQCVTKEHVDKPGEALPRSGADRTDDCKVTDYKVDGNKMSWNMTCTQPQPMTGSAEMLVDGDSYTGTMKMTMEGRQMTMKYDAKRLGDCEQ